MRKYDIDSYGFRAEEYETIIVFRDEDSFQKVIAANSNMTAIIGIDDYTKKNFPGVFIAGISPSLHKDIKPDDQTAIQK